MNWKRFGRKLSWPNLRYCPDVYLEELRKITVNLSHDVDDLKAPSSVINK
jgi:hypothetical protein